MENDNVTVVEVNGLQDYYRLIGCDCIEITNREIRGKRYDIICDDEGLLKAEPQVSAVNGRGEAMLVGNLNNPSFHHILCFTEY